MNNKSRIKNVIKYLIGMGIASNQKEIGYLLGYKTESAFSQVINGKVPMPDDFVKRSSSLSPSINQDWINTGVGNMIINKIYAINEDVEWSLVRERLSLYEEKIKFYKEKIEMLEEENQNLKKDKKQVIPSERVSTTK